MGNTVEEIRERFNPKEEVRYTPSGGGFFGAAGMDNGMSKWIAGDSSADTALFGSVGRLRNRSRDLERENNYFRRWLADLEANIIGSEGVRFTNKARTRSGKKLDEPLNTKIQNWWTDFSKRENFSTNRLHSRVDFSRLAMRSIARDGMVLIEQAIGIQKNPHRVAFRGLEVDHLAEDHSTPWNASTKIRMGVELDPWDEPMAYHLRRFHPGDGHFGAGIDIGPRFRRVPKERMLAPFLHDRFGQTIGVPWGTVAIRGLHQLGLFEEAAVINARIGAAKMGFFSEEGEDEYTGEEPEDAQGRRHMTPEPGTFEDIGKKSLHTFDTRYPDGEYPVFRKGVLRGIAAGLLVSYNTLGNDLEGVSYSSIRQGVLSDREIYRMIQAWFIDVVEGPLFKTAFETSLLSGTLDIPVSDLDRAFRPCFEGREWDWVDPLKDVQAAALEVGEGFNSRQRVARKRGRYFTEIVEEQSEDKDLAEDKGLKFGSKAEEENSKPEEE